MAYSVPYDSAYPDGATTPANTIDTVFHNTSLMLVERIEDITGVDFSTEDPLQVKKLGTGATQSGTMSGKLLYKTEFDAGNSGAAKTLSFTTDGPVQKLTLTASCTLTIATPPAGASGILRVVQNGTGGWLLTFPANWNTQANVPLVVVTTALTATIFSWYSDGAVVYYGLFGTAFDVS